jgi:hypothetical protein
MRNHEVTRMQALLDGRGNLVEPGWSRRLVQKYDRSQIKAPGWRIKEWDYYLIVGRDFAGAFTISDDGYIGLQSVSLLGLGEKFWEHTETVLNLFPMGRLKLPPDSSSGDTTYGDKRLQMRFSVKDGVRRITCHFEKFWKDKPFDCDIALAQPDMDSMVIATPWDKEKHFYYNQKINCMRASGWMEYDGVRYTFDPATDFGTLDWGRGVWTYDNTWYWGSGNADIGGNAFGFNIGYGWFRQHQGSHGERAVLQRCGPQAGRRDLPHSRERIYGPLDLRLLGRAVRDEIQAHPGSGGKDRLQAAGVGPAPGVRPDERSGDPGRRHTG